MLDTFLNILKIVFATIFLNVSEEVDIYYTSVQLQAQNLRRHFKGTKNRCLITGQWLGVPLE